MKYTFECDENHVVINDEKRNGVVLQVGPVGAEFLKTLINYANFGADMEASAEEELDTSDINNFTE